MLDVTSGPPQGGMIGNALDKGAGYSPYFDHFGFSCGLEIVLGNGELLRTGDGALDSKDLINWHTSKYSFGPILDGLFTQSNFGIVTRMGVWLLPRPPAVPAAETVELRADIVPRVQRSLSVRLGGREPGIPGKRRQALDLRRGRRHLRERHRLGAWNVSGAFYGPSAAAMEPQIQRVRDMFGQSGKARYISHEDAAAIPPLQVAINAFSGVPSMGELGLLKWRPGGGNIWFLPGTPMDGRVANEFQRLCRKIYEQFGHDRDECLQRALRPRAACHHIQPRGCRRARPRRCLLPDNVGRSRRPRRVRRPCAGGLSRLPHAPGNAGVPRCLHRHQSRA
jgi:4-cresol dehydrogenase (hydroxylating)